jgi:glycosyltransferase involved in cell wall biosynthesis
MKIVHLTSAHPRYDTRIFLKMCRSVAAHGHQVTLVVADGKGDEIREGVEIVDVGASSGRLDRMTAAPGRVLQRARELAADIYHLHDPELLPIARGLRRGGARVVFDSHEDYPAAMFSKPYIPAPARPLAAAVFGLYERLVCRRLDGVIAATPFIRDKFLRQGVRCLDVNNYPMTDELASEVADGARNNEVCYIGGIGAIRGIREVVDAMGRTRKGTRLSLGGPFESETTKAEVAALPGWAKVDHLGNLSRPQVRDVMGRSLAGIVTFLPLPNHVAAQPNKMFEYMSAGLPVIASNFPLWREIIEGNDCGLCVDPEDPADIAAAIDHLAGHPEDVLRMGANGRKAVLERYNWAVEEGKLLEFYGAVSAGRPG